MESDDWKSAADDYDRDVLSVFDSDRAGKVRSLFERFGWKHRAAADLGCGPGKFLPLLCERFGTVHGCDYSQEMLHAARENVGDFDNITLERCDLRSRPPRCEPVDFALCVNVLILPSLLDRERMWSHVAATIKPGGRLALVVPSLESALLARHRLVEWNLRSGISPKRALRRSFGDEDPDGVRIARGGILDAGGTLTKHYLREEIETTAGRSGLGLEACDKIEYPWTTEFNHPPKWMHAPYPWDWLALMVKT